MSVILQAKNLTKTFIKDQEKLLVLNSVNLDVYKGEVICILGASGCGKSTLLRLLAGLDMPDSGTVIMNNRKIDSLDVSRILIFQDFNQLFPWKTVLENVTYPMKVNKLLNTSDERKVAALKYLDMVGLNGFENSYPYQLSGGMKQKAVIARALVLKSDILLMDEPFGSLDAITRASMQEMLLQVWKETGVTIVFVTHDINEAILLSNRIVVMSRQHDRFTILPNNQIKRSEPIAKNLPELYLTLFGLLEE